MQYPIFTVGNCTMHPHTLIQSVMFMSKDDNKYLKPFEDFCGLKFQLPEDFMLMAEGGPVTI